MVLHEGASSKRIDVIFDVYRENSLRIQKESIEGLSMEMNLEISVAFPSTTWWIAQCHNYKINLILY